MRMLPWEEQEYREKLEDERDTLRKALEELISVAERCDSWESFPSAPLDEAYAALSKTENN